MKLLSNILKLVNKSKGGRWYKIYILYYDFNLKRDYMIFGANSANCHLREEFSFLFKKMQLRYWCTNSRFMLVHKFIEN